MVPQHGQGAVGEAARTVMVTSVVIRTCSITRSERSGMMVIGSHWIWKTSRRRTCLVLQYTTCGISGPAEEPYPVRFDALCVLAAHAKRMEKPTSVEMDQWTRSLSKGAPQSHLCVKSRTILHLDAALN